MVRSTLRSLLTPGVHTYGSEVSPILELPVAESLTPSISIELYLGDSPRITTLLSSPALLVVEIPGNRLSAAAAIRAFQSTLRGYRVRPESYQESLWSQLRIALLDDYQRNSSKTSRNYPRKKKRDRIGAPKITRATKEQITAAQELKKQQPEFQLPA